MTLSARLRKPKRKDGGMGGDGWRGGGGRDGGRGQRLSLFPRTILTMGISEHYF